MTEIGWFSGKIEASHISRLAYIYIRQSTMGQVVKHKESQDLQYGLSKRAKQLGWPEEAIKIIDDDLGQSGASSAERQGFQQLITQIGLGRVGIVLSYDASRLARNNKDWYQLLELCTLFDTLIADSERIYNASLYHDRLLLGLSGLMSEAELHQIRRRMLAGKRAKAERGDLQQRLPAGLMRLPTGEVIKHANEEVRSRIALVFSKFQEIGTANALARYFRQANLQIPVRPSHDHDSSAHEWRDATRQLILYILHNPAYAGAFVYGRKKNANSTLTNPEELNSRQWEIVVHDRYPRYISWDTFLANQERLAMNLANYKGARPGAVKEGSCLLQGILICRHCGLHMYSQYGGSEQNAFYLCSRPRSEMGTKSCQNVNSKAFDSEVEQLLLAALAPDQVAIAAAAHEKAEQERVTLHHQWKLRIERLSYEVERAQRQYNHVEPENRLVARSLEHAWENKLSELAHVEQDFATWQYQESQTALPMEARDLSKIAEEFSALWYSPSTAHSDKKEMIRLLISHVIVEQDYQRGKTWFQINWQTGAISHHTFIRPVNRYDDTSDKDLLQHRMRQLAEANYSAREMAEILNRDGFRTAERKMFTRQIVNNLRHKWKIASQIKNFNPPDQWEDGSYSVRGAAKILGISEATVLKRIARGCLTARQNRKGAPWYIELSETVQK